MWILPSERPHLRPQRPEADRAEDPPQDQRRPSGVPVQDLRQRPEAFGDPLDRILAASLGPAPAGDRVGPTWYCFGMAGQKFVVEIEREDDGRWIAEVLALPGAMAYGKSREEALAKAEVLALRVLADRLEHGEAIPAIDGLFEAA